MAIFLKNIVQLILSPAQGWEDVSATASEPRRLASKGMYPLFGLAAATLFVQLVFHPDYSGWALLVKAAAIFVSLFASFVLAEVLFRTYLWRMIDGEYNAQKASTVLVYAYSLLALSITLCNLIPVTLGLPFILPVCIALIVWKASTYLCVRDDMDIAFFGFIIGSVIVPPVLIQQLFDWAVTA